MTWLPGTEGGGLADVLVGDGAGGPRQDFIGSCPPLWPKTADMADGALYEFGYGLTYRTPKIAWAPLPEDSGVAAAGDSRIWFAGGCRRRAGRFSVSDPNPAGARRALPRFPPKRSVAEPR